MNKKEIILKTVETDIIQYKREYVIPEKYTDEYNEILDKYREHNDQHILACDISEFLTEYGIDCSKEERFKNLNTSIDYVDNLTDIEE